MGGTAPLPGAMRSRYAGRAGIAVGTPVAQLDPPAQQVQGACHRRAGREETWRSGSLIPPRRADRGIRAAGPERKLRRKISAESGGVCLPLLSFDQLPEVFRTHSEEKTERCEIFLCNSPLLFARYRRTDE